MSHALGEEMATSVYPEPELGSLQDVTEVIKCNDLGQLLNE
jgi:hypothetical protein